MTLVDAEIMAKEIIAEHLTGWGFVWDNRKRALGSCQYDTKSIRMSKAFVNGGLSVAEVKDTVLHEVAHALVGPGNGHNAVWKAKAQEIGAKSNATAKDLNLSYADLGAKWVLVDLEGNVYKHWFRKPRKTTFDKVPYWYYPNNKKGTLGKLSIIPFEM